MGNEAWLKGSEGTEFSHLRQSINVYNPLHKIWEIMLLRTEVQGLPSARIPVSLNEQLSVQEQLKVTGKKWYVTVNYFF